MLLGNEQGIDPVSPFLSDVEIGQASAKSFQDPSHRPKRHQHHLYLGRQGKTVLPIDGVLAPLADYFVNWPVYSVENVNGSCSILAKEGGLYHSS